MSEHFRPIIPYFRTGREDRTPTDEHIDYGSILSEILKDELRRCKERVMKNHE